MSNRLRTLRPIVRAVAGLALVGGFLWLSGYIARPVPIAHWGFHPVGTPTLNPLYTRPGTCARSGYRLGVVDVIPDACTPDVWETDSAS
jgi:hypothetical protein